MSGFFDLFRKLLGWWSSDTGAVGGPYRVTAGEVFAAGATAGSVFCAGAEEGEVAG
jgi:hypothetical protein